MRRDRVERGFDRVAGAAFLGLAFLSIVTFCSRNGAGAATPIGQVDVVFASSSPNAGQPLNSGGSATPFSLKLPRAAACTGDSANGGYRVQSFMIPATVEPTTLTFSSSGPIPPATGAGFREPLFSPTGSPFVNAQTAAADTTGGPGPIVNIPNFDYGVFSPGDIPAGPYLLGIACTLGPPSGTQLDKLWDVKVTFSTAPGDSPAQVTWSVAAVTTTTSSSTTTTVGTTTTTSSTTTTVPTTTTTTTSSTTTTVATTTTTSTTTTTVASTTTTSGPVAATTTTSTVSTDGTTATTAAGTATGTSDVSGGSTTAPSASGALPVTGFPDGTLMGALLAVLLGWALVRLSRLTPPRK